MDIIIATALTPTGICLMGTDDHNRGANPTCPGQKKIVVVLFKIRKEAGGICTGYAGPMVVLLVPFQEGKGRWPNHALFPQDGLYSETGWVPGNVFFAYPVLQFPRNTILSQNDQILRKNCRIWHN